MSKATTLFRQLKRLSFSRMNQQIKQVHSESGKASVLIFFDMVWCSIRYGVGYLNYHVFGFADKHGAIRKTYMTEAENLSLVRRLNDRNYYKYFCDKSVFNRTFSDYIGRQWLDLLECDADAFAQFCADKDTLFAKPVGRCGGSGVRKIICSEIKDFGSLYNELRENEQVLVEQAIRQHPDMDRLYSGSVNTLRIVTLLDANRNPHIMYSLLRVGQGGSCVDNISSGGMYTAVNDDGSLKEVAFCDKTGQYYRTHPDTKIDFSSFVVPYFKNAQELCKRAASVETHIGYVGWDVAITPNGPILVEGNIIPGYDMCQNSAFAEHGILPEFRKVTDGQKN